MTNFCPCCGYNISPDQPVELDGWKITPRDGAYFNGTLVVKRASWTTILHAVATMAGKLVSSEALLARISESENNNTLASQISQLRAHLKNKGILIPIEGQRVPNGYRWSA